MTGGTWGSEGAVTPAVGHSREHWPPLQGPHLAPALTLKPNAVSALQCAPGHLKLTLPSQPPLRSGGQEDLCRLWTANHRSAGESKEVSRSSGKEDPRTSQGSLGDDVDFWTVCPLKH